MRTQNIWLLVAWPLVAVTVSRGSTVTVKPAESLSAVREKLAADASITDVVVVTGNDNVVRRCVTEDVGGGVYVGGENAIVEGCRLHKQRDSFMVPMYAQDDTGIQYYHPARGGAIRGNLCEGFGMGVFIEANNAPYVVAHNTLVGLGQGLGFGATSWHPQQRFRYNIIADCDRQVEVYVEQKEGDSRDSENCLRGGSKAIVNYNEYKGEMKRFVSMAQWREFSGLDAHTLFADPLYRDTAGWDFHLEAKSPNRGAGADGTTIGALGD